jgi:hypothetical protein
MAAIQDPTRAVFAVWQPCDSIGPTSRALRRSNSTSLEGSERVPSLSLRRWMRKPGSLDSNKKQDSPPGAWASVRKMSQEG